MQHIPVMKNSVIKNIKLNPYGLYFDGTFGRGGHSLEFLKSGASLIAMDKDLEAIEYANENFSEYSNFKIKHGSFKDIDLAWEEFASPMLFDGIFFDFGVSSPQLDCPERGFSFLRNGPLDMRFNTNSETTAKDWVNSASLEEMTHVFQTYGQERFSYKIAKDIISARSASEIKTTQDLAKIITKSIGYKEKKHPATRVFQAIRIHINSELEDLKVGVEKSWDLLKEGGRIVFLTFHSLEDKIIKDFLSPYNNFLVLPSDEEVAENPRARSVKLRWAIKEEL